MRGWRDPAVAASARARGRGRVGGLDPAADHLGPGWRAAAEEGSTEIGRRYVPEAGARHAVAAARRPVADRRRAHDRLR